jgi:hypothetical protein
MSRHQEVLQRAIDEQRVARERLEAMRAEIVRQQRAALAGFPKAIAALDKHEQAIATAEATYQHALEGVRAKAGAAQDAAMTAQADADIEATAAWRQATEDADAERRAADAAADSAYDVAFNAATRTAGKAHEPKLADARARRAQAQAKAAAKYVEATDAAWMKHQRGTEAAREKAIEAVATIRRQEEADAAAAGNACAAKKATAERALQNALAAEPLAGAVLEAFQSRLRDVEARCEDEKRRALDDMKRGLALGS